MVSPAVVYVDLCDAALWLGGVVVSVEDAHHVLVEEGFAGFSPCDGWPAVFGGGDEGLDVFV